MKLSVRMLHSTFQDLLILEAHLLEEHQCLEGMSLFLGPCQLIFQMHQLEVNL